MLRHAARARNPLQPKFPKIDPKTAGRSEIIFFWPRAHRRGNLRASSTARNVERARMRDRCYVRASALHDRARLRICASTCPRIAQDTRAHYAPVRSGDMRGHTCVMRRIAHYARSGALRTRGRIMRPSGAGTCVRATHTRRAWRDVRRHTLVVVDTKDRARYTRTRHARTTRAGDVRADTIARIVVRVSTFRAGVLVLERGSIDRARSPVSRTERGRAAKAWIVRDPRVPAPVRAIVATCVRPRAPGAKALIARDLLFRAIGARAGARNVDHARSPVSRDRARTRARKYRSRAVLHQARIVQLRRGRETRARLHCFKAQPCDTLGRICATLSPALTSHRRLRWIIGYP